MELSVIISLISIVVSIIAIVVAIYSWHKNRAIYGIERMVMRQFDGSINDMTKNEEYINEKLKSGEYTILLALERTKGDNDWEVLLGRIKPYN